MSFIMTVLIGVAHAQCGGLVGRVTVPISVARINWEHFGSDSYRLSEGPLRLTPAHPARVIVVDGGDALLAIDADQALREGVARFLRTLGIADDADTERWIHEVRVHFDRLVANPAPDLQNMSLLRARKADFLRIEQVSFARFLDAKRRRRASSASDPERDLDTVDRIALISLRHPERSRTASPPRAPEALAAISAVRADSAGRAMLQFKAKSGGRYVVNWDVPDLPKPMRNTKASVGAPVDFFQRALATAVDFKRRASGSDVVLLPWFDLESVDATETPRGLLYELHFGPGAEGEQVSITSVRSISLAEMLEIQADFNRRHLDSWQATRIPGLRLADSTSSTAQYVFTLNAIDVLLRSLPPARIAEFEALEPGETKTFRLGPLLDSKSGGDEPRVVRTGRGLVLHRAADGALYLVGFLKTDRF